MTEIAHLFNWFEHATGMNNVSGPEYGFYSGFGSDISEIFQLAIVCITSASLLHHNNCHVHGCWRISHKKTAAGDAVCRRHNPEPRLTHLDIVKRHKEANNELSTSKIF